MKRAPEGNRLLSKGISVVIPTSGRVTYAERLLESLHSELEFLDEPTEVIVVDSSKPKESQALSQVCKKLGYKFHHIKRGISRARNYGIEAAKFLIVLFIDSDCMVFPGLLREHILSYTDEDIGGVLGLTKFMGHKNWVWKIVERTPFLIPFSFARRMDCAPWGPCTNISFRKEVLLEVEGFRTDFPFDFSGEDVDLGLRISKRGYKITCNPKAIAYHSRETWSSLTVLLKKIFRWGRTGFHILTQHSYLSTTDFPKFISVSLLIVALAILYGLFGLRWKMIMLPILWSLCVPAIDAVLRSSSSKTDISDFVFNYFSFWLVFVYEFGLVYESMKNHSFEMLYKRHLYGAGQLLFEWRHRLIQNWSFIISLIVLVVFALI